jgi:arabinan endo-1,5-alpha-L-arabinosidase
MPELKGVQDFYLTAEGLGGETLLGNIKFDEGPKDTTTSIRRVAPRNDMLLRVQNKKYHDLKGRRFDKQIPYRVLF